MNKIRDWLYVGKYVHTANLNLLKRANISAMLQLAEHVKQPQVDTLYLPVDDGVALPDGALKKGVSFIRAHKLLGNVVLVACGAGISRSVTFAMAAMIEEEKLTFADAYREIFAVHPDAMPNPFLCESLSAYYDFGYDLMTIMDQLESVQRGK